MKIIYHFKCEECKHEIGKLMEYEEIEFFISENSCKFCDGKLKRVYGFSAGHFKGEDFTKRST